MDHCHRDRSYSRDSVQYASESSSSIQDGGHARGRADTGDSSFSSDTNGSMGLRRRSHRPRGCRGGRKNRKKKNKVPIEIVGPSPVSPSGGSSNNNPPSTAREAGPSVLPGSHHCQTFGSGSDYKAATLQGHASPLKSYAMASAVQAVHTYPAMHSNTNHQNTPYSNTPYTLDPRHAEVLNHQPPPLATMSNRQPSQPTLATMGGILPPPPKMKPTEFKITTGPNPYALTKNNDAYALTELSHSVSLGSSYGSLTGIETFSSDDSFGYNHSAGPWPSNNGSGYSNPTFSLETTLLNSGGGSLFVVSPRSFLTGAKKGTSFHA
jgi:hypothetical protein